MSKIVKNNIASDTQTGTVSNGSAVITGLSDTSALVVNQEINAPGFVSGTHILSIDSSTQVTATQKYTGSNSTESIDFDGLVIEDTGVVIPASGQYILNSTEYRLWEDSTDINVEILSGNVTVNDGIGDLIAARGISFIRDSDIAFGHRFLSDPERANGFDSKNVQEAIEESRNFRAVPVVFTKSGAVTINTFLLNGSVPSNIAGRTIPSTATNVKIALIEIANQDISTFDIGVFEQDGDEINLTLIKTYTITSARTAEVLDGVTALDAAKQVAVKLTSGSAKNLSVSLTISGKRT